MVSSVEMVLWAIHHATTLLFGVFASAALCGIEINRRHALELVLVGAVTGCAFGLANAVGGELFARQVYPLVVHLPLVIYLCARYRLSPLLAVLGITSAYLSCQFSNWMGIAAFAATDSQIAYYLARIATTLAVFAVLLHWAGDIGPRLAIKSTTELGILLILPLVYYVFDYATNVYTTLFHSGSVVTVEFLAFALCAFYLMFLAVYLREYEEKETAERERWMLETRDSAAVPETIHVGDADLFSVLSNALENAITAASTAPQGKRFVNFDLRLENGQLLLLVSNTFDRAPRMVDGMPVAGHTGHGFGTKSIKLAVERMNGNCQFRINGDRFELRAVM